MKKTVLIFLFISLVFLIFTLFSLVVYADHRLHIYVCDIGQGDGILIRTPKGEDIIIDGGPDDSILSCLSSHMPFWDRTIELMIMTHPDADHSTGLTYVLERYTVLSFMTEKLPGKTQIYKKLIGILAEKKLSAKYLYAGDKISEDSGLVLTTYWPSLVAIQEGEQNISKSTKSLNEFAVVELLTYKNFKGLFTADAGSNIEDTIGPGVGKIDFLKVPHHGSRTGMSKEFLDGTRPSLAVISVGAKNRYGHPAPFSLELLKNAGIKTLRTDQNGTVQIDSDGDTFSFKSER